MGPRWSATLPRMAPPRAAPRPPVLLAVACGLAAFALYAWTTSPHVLNEDVAEFQALSATHGISHAGYPGYLLLLEAAHALPVSTPAYRANLVSAACAAVAVALAVLACFDLTRSRLAAVASAVALALSYSLWSDATRAEVYAYTLALSAAAFCALLAYRETSRTRALLWCAVLTGAALAGHLGSLAIAAVVAWTVLRQVLAGRAPRAHLAVAVGGVALGLLPLVLIPLRDVPQTAMNYIAYTFDAYAPRHIEWAPDWMTRLRRTALLLSGSQYLEGGWFSPFRETLERLRMLGWHLLFNDLHFVGTALAGIGLAASVRARARGSGEMLAWLVLLLLLVALAAFPMVLASFFLPGLWLLCVWLGVGFARIAGRARALALGVLALLFVSPFVRLRSPAPPPAIARPSVADAWAVWPKSWNPFRPDGSWEHYGRSVLEAVPPRGDLIVCWEEGTTLRYLQLAEGLRPDVVVHMACDSPPRIARILADAARRGAAVHATLPAGRLPDPATWVEVGRWDRGRLAVRPPAPPASR
jgi:hypothetical protein